MSNINQGMSNTNQWTDYYGHTCGSRTGRYTRALGVAMIIFGAVVPDRFGFFWAGVILCACSGLL